MGDNIKKPDHYCDGRKYEPKDVIRDWGLNFNLGSCVKYISRAGRKGDKLEDLQKAKQFLEFEIEAATKEEEHIEHMTRAYTNRLLYRVICLSLIPDEYKPRVIDRIAQKVMDSEYDIKNDISSDELRKLVIDRIVERLVDGELSLLDIPCSLFNYIGMTSKEAAEIGDAIAKGFEEGFKESEENSDIEIEAVNERLINGYVRGILSQVIEFNSIPDEYKPIVIDKIAQKVLNNRWNIARDIPTKELQDMVIDWIVELINSDNLDRMDIPDGLYDECARIRQAIANREYRKTMNAAVKHMENTIQVTINFNDEED